MKVECPTWAQPGEEKAINAASSYRTICEMQQVGCSVWPA